MRVKAYLVEEQMLPLKRITAYHLLRRLLVHRTAPGVPEAHEEQLLVRYIFHAGQA